MPERTVTPDQTPAPAPTSTQQQPPPSPPEWAGAAERIERIEAMLDEAGPAAVELVKELLALYGEGLARILALAGEAVAVEVAADELVSPLLLLHDLHPLDTRTRAEAAVAGLGGEIVSVADGLVRVRVRSSGCRTSATAEVEQAIRAVAPEVDRVEIEPDERPLIPLDTLTIRRGPVTR
ncbi:NifU family protein [Nonomuraea antimicrobica]|uniref:NifU family protein n=1 Tax=Nonomuraea antimicrobica TaxID=561173 RepID=A0ABP7BRE0_9ACTN